MQRRKGSAYEVSAATVAAYAAVPDAFGRARHANKSDFHDLRVEASDKSISKTTLGLNKVTYPPKAKMAAVGSGAYQAPAVALMMPSATPNGLKRCQSASTIRRKLQTAVEQSAHSYEEQVAALRSLSATSIVAKPTPQTILTRGGNDGSNQARVPPHADERKPHYSTLFTDTSTIGTSTTHAKRAPTAGFKSTSIELEVELAERLNEIERSTLNEKVESRFRASQRAFERVIQQDEPFGRILASIRDEYEAYVAFLLQNAREQRNNNCRCSVAGGNQHRDDTAPLRQENSVLKRNCTSLQREIEVLQASLLASAIHKKNATTATTFAALKGAQRRPEDDSIESSTDDVDLVDIPLLSLGLERIQPPHRPSNVPQLDFSCLSPYRDEDDDYENDVEGDY